ncbi:hypothetical protein BpHYR1_029292 [Brachionus plicatilis]|uniref:Uncharacterized protein n=1 Tax=Brachionus plicatilis TaxID=10195 RepID=A0A3M7P7N5_BRAPC|nr:hypothetical protein BpHYR1_029292 [Brachionus plicatilis]
MTLMTLLMTPVNGCMEQKSSPCYKICTRGWEEFLCFLIFCLIVCTILRLLSKLKETLFEQTNIISFHLSNSQLLTKFILDTIHEKYKDLPTPNGSL